MAVLPLDTSESSTNTDLVTFAFEGSCEVDEKIPIYVDAEDPSRRLNKYQTRTLVKRFVAGFRAVGLQSGECVLVVLPNDVSATGCLLCTLPH